MSINPVLFKELWQPFRKGKAPLILFIVVERAPVEPSGQKVKRSGYVHCRKFRWLLVPFAVIILLAGCGGGTEDNSISSLDKPSPVEQIPSQERDVYDLVLLGARQEVKKGVTYDDSYQVIDYPWGDVSENRGACTDVVIRAFRHAGIDLQLQIHEDMKEHFNLYPQKWGLTGPDPNIDHRRVPNQVNFFSRFGDSLSLSTGKEGLQEWQWGDVVYWRFPNGLEHCGIISDRQNKAGIPLVIHNAGITAEEDCLNRWEITGHFRYPPGSM